jgi:transcriptional regulator with XRE-family HTH domain
MYQERRATMPFDLRLFGQRLRETRKDRGLSQQELAAQLGTAHGWISELENARQTHVQADTVYRFCEALGVTGDYLLGLTDDPTPPKRARRRQGKAKDAEEAA